mgnify:CR=1 FL=1
MNSVQSWISVICISAIACTMLEFMTPDGRMEKIVRLVFGAFMVIAIISPLMDTVSNIDISINNKKSILKSENNFSDKIYEQSLDVAGKNIRKVVMDELKVMDIKSKKIDVIMDKQDKDCISISKVKIYIDNMKPVEKEEVRKRLKDKLDIDIEVL